MANTIFFFLTREVVPGSYLEWLAESLGETGVSVYVMSDNDKPHQFRNATYCYVSDESCIEAGYKYCIWNKVDIAGGECPRHVNAWDKVLFYLNNDDDLKFDHVWICEDDIYVHTIQHLVNMISIYKDINADYVAKDFLSYDGCPNWCQWYVCEDLFDKKYWHGSFSAISRISRRLVVSCDNLAKNKGRLALIEALFPTICAQNNFSICGGWLQQQPVRPCPNVTHDEIHETLNKKPDAIFHPCKLSDADKFALMKK